MAYFVLADNKLFVGVFGEAQRPHENLENIDIHAASL
jgi:hypothetical protein